MWMKRSIHTLAILPKLRLTIVFERYFIFRHGSSRDILFLIYTYEHSRYIVKYLW